MYAECNDGTGGNGTTDAEQVYAVAVTDDAAIGVEQPHAQQVSGQEDAHRFQYVAYVLGNHLVGVNQKETQDTGKKYQGTAQRTTQYGAACRLKYQLAKRLKLFFMMLVRRTLYIATANLAKK